MTPDTFVIVAAHNEADRIAATLTALAEAFPHAPVWVADDGSTDGTARIAEAAGAHVVRCERVVGKGQAMTLAARAALERIAGDGAGDVAGLGCGGGTRAGGTSAGDARAGGTSAGGTRAGGTSAGDARAGGTSAGGTRAGGTSAAANRLHDRPIALLCDGDLGDSAALLGPLVEAVREGEAGLAVAAFSTRAGGGFGLAVGFAARAIRRRCGLALSAPISGQRALRADALAGVLPFAPGFGMEIGMTIDAARAGLRVVEVELNLSHRATGRTLAGFAHRGRQLLDFVRVYLARG